MLQRLNKRSEKDQGFTLIELLIVIIILGILAAIVVFAVGNVTDKGKTSSCSTDKKTVETAEEAYFAHNDQYGSMSDLTSGGKYLHEASTLYDVTVTGGGSGYTVNAISGNPDGCT